MLDDLRSKGTAKRAAGEKAYLKSDLDFMGVPVPELRRTAKRICDDDPEMSRESLLELVGAMWDTRWHEARSLGNLLLERRAELLRATDLAFVEALLRRARSWVYVDLLAIRVVGSLVARFASCRKRLPRWARDDDFWIRRSALLAELLPLRDGTADLEAWARLARSMLTEKEFFVRKAIGWVLREASKAKPREVEAFLSNHIDEVSGLTLREGMKRLPSGVQSKLKRRYNAR